MKRAALALALASMIGLGAAEPRAVADDFSDLAFDPRPGALLPIGDGFVDERGQAVTLGGYFSGKPVIVVLDYLRCKTLCGLTLAHVMTALGALPLAAGRDYQFLAMSIDPRDRPADAAAAKEKYLALYGRAADSGMHFLTGEGAGARRIADAIGFHYRYDAALDQYVHPAGFVIAAPDGRISRYVLAVAPSPGELERDLRDAAAGRADGPLKQFLLLCRVEGAPLGRYSAPILAAFALANLAAGVGLIVLFVAIRRRFVG